MRFAAWREIRGRWPLILLLPVCYAIAPLLPYPVDEAWRVFTLVVLTAPVLVLLAAGGPAAPDPFWRSLGGSPLAGLLVRTVLHLVPALLLAPEAFGLADFLEERSLGSWVEALLLLAFTALYMATLAARSVTSGGRVLVGPALALLVLWAGTWINAQVRIVPFQWSLAFRMGSLALVAFLLAVRWEGAGAAHGHALGRRGPRRMLAVLAFFLVTSLGDLTWRQPIPGSLTFLDHADGRLLLATPWWGAGRLGRAWLREGEETRLLDGVGVTIGSLGPNGAVFLATRGWRSSTAWLFTPTGEVATCEVADPIHDASWDEVGEEIRVDTEDHWGAPEHALDAGGCRLVPGPPWPVQEVVEGGHVYRADSGDLWVDGVDLTSQVCPNTTGCLDIKILGGAEGVMGFAQTWRWSRSRRGHLFRFEDGQVQTLERLEDEDRWIRYDVVGDRVCRAVDETTERCWDASGRSQDRAWSSLRAPRRQCLVPTETGCTLSHYAFQPAHGEVVRFPPGYEATWGRFALLDPDHVRVFDQNGYRDHGAEGWVGRRY